MMSLVAASDAQDMLGIAGFWPAGDKGEPEILGALGGLILFIWNVVWHWKLPKNKKHPSSRYTQWFVFQLIMLPALGSLIVWVDTTGGSTVGPLLALQVGLTGPKLLESIMVGAANKKAGSPTGVHAD
jgi:hypothetical protein